MCRMVVGICARDCRRGLADEDPGNLSIAYTRPTDFFYSELAPFVPVPARLGEVALTDGRGRRLALRG